MPLFILPSGCAYSKQSKGALTSSVSQNSISYCCFPSPVLWGSNWISFHFFFLTLRLLGFSVLSEKSIRNVYLMGQIAMEQHVYHFEGHNLQAAMAPIRFVLKHRGWKRKMSMSAICDGDVQNCISPDTHFFMSLYFDCQSLHICCLKSLQFTTSSLKKTKPQPLMPEERQLFLVDIAEIRAPKGVTLNCRLLWEVKARFRKWWEECFGNSHARWSLYDHIPPMSGYPVCV